MKLVTRPTLAKDDSERECDGCGAFRYAEAEIPTAEGPLQLVVYRECHDGIVNPLVEHVALIVGSPLERRDDVLVRVHSECITSEVFGSLKCDCREQLEAALERMRGTGSGIVLYLRQEGRGIGLGNKIRAYALQARGYDTVEANHQLGFEADLRTYDIAACMLHDLGVRGVSLLTNNPEKISGLTEHGIRVVRRLAIEVAPTLHTQGYLNAKRQRFGHLLDLALEPAE